MQVTAGVVREHEKPMSWPRAMLIATGFFFVTAIFLGQIPSYVYTVATLSTLARLEQGFLSLGLLSLGMGLMSLEISFLYDPRPLIPWPLFALLGAGIAAVGSVVLLMVWIGPYTTIPGTNQTGWLQLIPGPGQYFISPIWFQPNSIDLGAIGTIALLTGLGVFALAVLNPWVLSGRAFGPTRDLLVRFCVGLAVTLIALYVAVLTFVPGAFHPINTDPQTHQHTLGTPFAWGNMVLFLALLAALAGLMVWLLPIMTTNRQQFMPAVYFHGVINLIGLVAIPLLIVWAVIYPLIYAIQSVDTDKFWVECSQKNKIPASCSFTPFTGYIICAIVFQALFTMLIVGIYFWSTRRNTVVLGGTVALVWLGLAAMVLHTAFQGDLPTQQPTGIMIAVAVTVLAFIFTWATQREFASTRAEPLGCTGQWLVFGTLMLIFLFGFAFFSIPEFFELESGLALFFQPGVHGLHDAIWGTLLMAGVALLQFFVLLRRRQPMSDLRKFALWSLLLAVVLMIIASIQGFTHDPIGELGNGTDAFLNAIEGSHVVFFFGLLFALAGVLATLWGAWLAGSMRWMLIIAIVLAAGAVFAGVIYSLSYATPPINLPDLTAFGIMAALGGAFAYTALGPDFLGEGNPLAVDEEPLVVAPR
jgi:hypothetical protein